MDKGMEFVLALEAPCLGHIRGDPDAPDQASGHVLTTSSYVLDLSLSPSSSSSLPSSPDSNAASITETLGSAPRAILDRLITLSTALTLEDEVTPVQAWNRIHAHLQLGTLREDRLQPLVSKLAGAVKCHGYVHFKKIDPNEPSNDRRIRFGAVLKVDIFEKLLREVLIIGPAR
ncbi:hypothetical protein B0T18DRAFT_239833 [Schizothecium vesticola]|uniref:Uncharacterized protein n=1 Tax=Schizothecium vesticola TaxID=314040 RepID=A0AA40BPR3_9PEZI|nr:hypothetical protein B0T18DRAFT_239833 [Schizothecium vesticola]